MTVTVDPIESEAAVLRELIDFTGRRVLEIGCGDGRVTWQYARQTASVIGIDPDRKAIERAIKNRPVELSQRIAFLERDIKDFTVARGDPGFDVVFFTRSLC